MQRNDPITRPIGRLISPGGLTAAGLAVMLSLIVAVPVARGQIRDRIIQRRFESMDKNGDGKLSAAESPNQMAIQRFDKDADGALSLDEFRSLATAMLDRRAQPQTPPAIGPHQPAPVDANRLSPAMPLTAESIVAAARYNAQQRGISMWVMYDGKLIYQDYPNGGAADRAHELASGTKTFNAAIACAAIDDGLLRWDERVSDTITSWRSDPRKRDITVEQLLRLTSGIKAVEGKIGRVPAYVDAIRFESVAEPGTEFAYGPVPFQCFGELMRRKLTAAGVADDPLDYLNQRVFEPIGLKYDRWRRDANGQPHMPSGAYLTASQWAKFGELIRNRGRVGDRVILSEASIERCMSGGDINPTYGIATWLNQPISEAQRRKIPQLRRGTDAMMSTELPSDLVFAAGAGKQRLYVIPSLKLTIVRQSDKILESLNGKISAFSDQAFLTRLLVDRDRRSN